jgi:hypothetical protein
MRPPLKLSAIDQEHLQELYDMSGVARDELPYTLSFDDLCQGFQDRTFKNAQPEQIFAALLKHVRSGGNPSKEAAHPLPLNEEQLKRLKGLLPRHAKGGKLLPYSEEFDAAHKEFVKLASVELTAAEFWRAISKSSGAKRRPPTRAKVVAAAGPADDDDGE